MKDKKEVPGVLEKDRRYRDRQTKERKVKGKLKDNELEHPVHEPYYRQRINWKQYFNEKSHREDI